MAEGANSDQYAGRYVRMHGPCGCEKPSHYITLDRGPVKIKTPPLLAQVDHKKYTRNKVKQEEITSQRPPTPCCFTIKPAKLFIPLKPDVTLRPPLAAAVAPSNPPPPPPPPQFVSRPPVPRVLNNNLRPRSLVNELSLFKGAPHRFASPSLHENLQLSRRLSSPPQRHSTPPVKPQVGETLPKRQRKKPTQDAVKLTKQPTIDEERELVGSAGIAAAGEDALSTQAVIDADNARFAAAIRAQLATPVPMFRARGDGVSADGDMLWRPRHQPTTFAGIRLAAALAERRRAKLRIGLRHLDPDL